MNVSRLQKLKKIIAHYAARVARKELVLPKTARIVEVGPRDGLQNEKKILETEFKIEMINRLSETGLSTIEATSFVSPKWVPQMGDNIAVYEAINKKDNITYTALVPNERGMNSALKVNCQEIALFTAASEEFVKHNINCTIDESFEKAEVVMKIAQEHNIPVRGYVSCVMGCPYSGDVDPKVVDYVSNRLIELGCYEVSLGDTIGVGTPEKTIALMEAMTVPFNKLAAHFHDTNDTAIENILIALTYGINVFDSSVAGLGGCPYAKTDAGNVCSENVIYTLEELGVSTGVNLEEMCKIGDFVSEKLGRKNLSLIKFD